MKVKCIKECRGWEKNLFTEGEMYDTKVHLEGKEKWLLAQNSIGKWQQIAFDHDGFESWHNDKYFTNRFEAFGSPEEDTETTEEQ